MYLFKNNFNIILLSTFRSSKLYFCVRFRNASPHDFLFPDPCYNAIHLSIIDLTDVTVLGEGTVYSTKSALLSLLSLPVQRKVYLFLLYLYFMQHTRVLYYIYYVTNIGTRLAQTV
jgi:hypothetical protein